MPPYTGSSSQVQNEPIPEEQDEKAISQDTEEVQLLASSQNLTCASLAANHILPVDSPVTNCFTTFPLSPMNRSLQNKAILFSNPDSTGNSSESISGTIATLHRISATFQAALDYTRNIGITDAEFCLSCKHILALLQLSLSGQYQTEHEGVEARKALIDAVEYAIITFIYRISPVIQDEDYLSVVGSECTYEESPGILAVLLETADAYIFQSQDYMSQLRMVAAQQLLKDDVTAYRILEERKPATGTRLNDGRSISKTLAAHHDKLETHEAMSLHRKLHISSPLLSTWYGPQMQAYTTIPSIVPSASYPSRSLTASPSLLSTLRSFTPSPSDMRTSNRSVLNNSADLVSSLDSPRLEHRPTSFYAHFKDAFGLIEPLSLQPENRNIDMGCFETYSDAAIDIGSDPSSRDSPDCTVFVDGGPDHLTIEQVTNVGLGDARNTEGQVEPCTPPIVSELVWQSSRSETRTAREESRVKELLSLALLGSAGKEPFGDCEAGTTVNSKERSLEHQGSSSPLLLDLNQGSPLRLRAKLGKPQQETGIQSKIERENNIKKPYFTRNSTRINSKKRKVSEGDVHVNDERKVASKLGARFTGRAKICRVASTSAEKENKE
ncbi:hypothetical protein AX17_002606 [Amanita inopinata Kibby_2008]|nr:hypothetical protein AX17_002606 [Amanita inopinata Kibby_2008]